MIPVIQPRHRRGGWIFSILLGFLLAYTIPGAAQTEVGGQITENTTWRLALSPYIVTGEIRVWNNSESTKIVELKIEPGVAVELNGFEIRVGNQADKGHPANQGRMIAEQVSFFGKGKVVLACGKENHLAECVFDAVHLLLGEKVGAVSSGKIRDITMNHADITIYAGEWEITGGKLLNGTIAYKTPNHPGMKSREMQHLNFFMNMLSLP